MTEGGEGSITRIMLGAVFPGPGAICKGHFFQDPNSKNKDKGKAVSPLFSPDPGNSAPNPGILQILGTRMG